MAAESDFTKLTQDILGKYVKKPPLSKKLLEKPPFRFLFDVFNAVIRDTGYFAGLYTEEELKYENIKDREDKMRFLQKMIDVTKLATQSDIKVRASKIVAGHEPERTNELLQLMGTIIQEKLDWQSAVSPAVGDNESPTKKDITKVENTISKKTKATEEDKDVKPRKSSVKGAELRKKDESPTEGPKKRVSPRDVIKKKPSPTDVVKKKPSPTDSIKKKSVTSKEQKGNDSRTKVGERDSKNKAAKRTETDGSKTVKNVKEKKSSQKIVSPEIEGSHKVHKSQKTDSPLNQTSIKASEERRSSITNHQTTEQTQERPKAEGLVATSKEENNGKPIMPNRSSTTEQQTKQQQSQVELVERKNLPQSSLESQDASKENGMDKSVESSVTYDKSITTATVSSSVQQPTQPAQNPNPMVMNREATFMGSEYSKDNEIGQRPRTSLRPPSVRPPSARPSAPRRRDRNVEIMLQPNDSVKMSGINVKLESFADLADDGENLVIIEDATTGMTGLTEGENDTSADADKQLQMDAVQMEGHLVQQILKTQKELVQEDSNGIVQKEDNNNSFSMNQGSARQINNLRNIIQNITKSVNPFGKLMDFIPEDIDAMHLELTMWTDTYTQASNELKAERSLTESATEPMKQQLLQIDSSINEYLEMIDASRMKILQNNEKILNLLMYQ